MKEERINPNFNINKKYESMVETANSIVEHHLFVSDGSCEAPSYISLAFDVKKYLPVLQSQLKAKEEVIKEAREYVNTKLTEFNLRYGIDNEFRQEYDDLLEILSKGENK